MNTPRTRAEFERNFNLLHRQIADDKFRVNRECRHAISGIQRVRFLPNGRIDFLSVDESARLEANMIANMSDGLFTDQMKEYQGRTGHAGPESDPESSIVDADGKSY